MRRSCTFFSVALATVLALILTGCLGNSTPSSSSAAVRSISLIPSGNVSLQIGSTEAFAALAIGTNNHTIPGANVEYIVSSPAGSNVPPPLSITGSGFACAGSWDASQTICSPGNAGVAIVTAVANGVTSPQATVYVHEHIDTLKVTQAQTLPPSYDCFSQGQTWLYQGTAYNNGVDITSTVGQVIWNSTNDGVLSMNSDPPVSPPLPLNQVEIAASNPGVTQIYASVSGTTSTPMPIATCLIQQVRLQVSGTTASSVTVPSGNSIALEATAIDSIGNVAPNPPLTWITSNPEIVTFASASTTTGTNSATARANAGGADISAVCAPPNCNIGVIPNITIPTITPPYSEIDPAAMPAYAFSSDGPISPTNSTQAYGTIAVNVTNTPPTYTALAATDLCDEGNSGVTNGCVSIMFDVTPTTSGGTNPIGANVILPRTPNSIVSNHLSGVYIGSYQGLMSSSGGSGSATLISSSSTPCNVAVCGKVIAVSNDGNLVIVSDPGAPLTSSTTPQVYVYDNAAGNGVKVRDLVLPGGLMASAAAFSPDESKIFILTDAGKMYVYSPVSALAPALIPSFGADAIFSPDGSFAYIAGASGASGAVSAFSTCATSTKASTQLGPPSGSPTTVTTSGVPLQIFADPNLQRSSNSEQISQSLYVFEPPYIQELQARFTQVTNAIPTQPSQYGCNVPVLNSFTSVASYTIPEGSFTPVYANLVANGTEMIIVARHIPAVLIFNVANGTTRAVPLTNSEDPLAASASTDGSVVFVAACDQYVSNTTPPVCASGSVHIVNTITGYDQDVPYINNTTNNMCSGQGAGAPVCYPDLIVVKPQ